MRRRPALLGKIALGVTSLMGLGQAMGADDGYSAPEIKSLPPWLAIVIGAVLVAAIAAVAFKHSRRTHLD